MDYVNRYYAPAAEQPDNESATKKTDNSMSKPHGVDRQFHEQAWRWLVQHPDVRVGKDGEGNKLGLSQVEAFNEKSKAQKRSTKALPVAAPRVPNGATQDGLMVGQSPTQSATSTPTRIRSSQSGLSNKQIHGMVSNSPSAYRLYISEYRMWQALAGHGPDIKRIPPMQFSCLSIITSRRTQGILQSKLTELSSQDKRSVPHRTDLLAQNGYIEKRAVLCQATKTSLLYAKRFAPKTVSIPQESIDGQRDSQDDGKRGPGGLVDYYPIFDNITRLLKEPGIMTFVDLRKKLVDKGHQ